MGSTSNFCDCKNLPNSSCLNSLTLEEIQNFICPAENQMNTPKREFLSQSFNQNLTLDELIKKQAVNKIIRAYREYVIYKSGKLDNNNIDDNIYQNLNEDINLKQNKKKKVNFKQGAINKDDKYNNNSDFTLDKYGYSHTNESNNSENIESSKINRNIINNRNQNNINIKNHDSISDRLRNSVSSTKTIYIGGGNKEQKEGFGINLWNDEAKYIGYYKNNKAEGYGKFLAGDDSYQGEFKDDAANGYGIFSNGLMTYEGYWEKDLQEIYGIESWQDGSLYKGEYSEGKKMGIGVYTFPDGTSYEGMWENNTFNGFGIFYYSNDRYYLGEWKDKKKEGFGEFIWPEKKYIGFFFNDKKEGFGIIIYKNGNKAQIGFWKDGKQKGFGKFINKKKAFFGLWKGNNKVDWFKNDKDGEEYMLKNGLNKYKNFFEFNLEQIYDFCYNKDDLENIVVEQDKTKKNDI